MNIYEHIKIGKVGIPSSNLEIQSEGSDGSGSIFQLKNSNDDNLFQIDTIGRVGIQVAPTLATVTLPQFSRVFFQNQNNGNASVITTDAAQGFVLQNTAGAPVGISSDGTVALSGLYQDDLTIGTWGVADGKGTYLKAYNNTASLRTGIKYLTKTSGEPDVCLVPDGFGGVAIGASVATAFLDVYGNTATGQTLLRLYSNDWATPNERERLALTQGQLTIRVNNYDFHAAAEGNNAALTLHGDNAALILYSDSFLTDTFFIQNGNMPLISAPNSGLIHTDAMWSFSSAFLVPTASVHIQGSGTTNATKSFKVDNNTPVELFSIYDSGQISAGDGNLGLFMGLSSGQLISGSLYGTGFGVNALASMVTGNYNSAFGYGALGVLNGGDRNTGVGFATFAQLVTGFGNVGMGWGACSSAVNADGITAVGFSVLSSNTNSQNSGFGFSAAGNSTGTGLSVFGYQAGEFNIHGDDNSIFGLQAHRRNYIGTGNSVFGSIAGQANYADGSYNCYFGFEAGYANGLYNVTQGGDFNNTTDPLTVDMSVYNQFNGKLAVNDYITVDGEIFKVTVVAGPNITFARAQLGSTNVVHPDGDNIQGGRSRNTFLGTFSGSNSLSNDSVFIGYTAGDSETADDRFVLANTHNTLLYGDFANKGLALGTTTIISGDTFTIKSSTNDTSGRAFYFENSDASANFFMYNDGLINLNTTHGGVCFSIASAASSAIFNIGGTGSTGTNYKIGSTLTSSVYVDAANHIVGLLQPDVNYSITDHNNNELFFVKESTGQVAIGNNFILPTANLTIKGTNGYDQFNLVTSFTPANTADVNGHQGDIAWDDNNIYVKTSAGWKQAALTTF